MKLDFTALESLSKTGPPEDATAIFDAEEDRSIGQSEKAPKMAQRAPETIPHRLKKEAEERELMREAYRGYQRNIQRSEALRCEIAKGLNSGADLEDLFLKAIECITAMTGDNAFLTHCRKRLEE